MRNSPPFTNILVPWWKDSTYSKTVQTVWMSVWRWQASFILFIQSRKCWITWALDWKGYRIHYSDSISRYSYIISSCTWPFLTSYQCVSTHLKNMSQIGNLPQVGVKIKNIWNHHLAMYEKSGIWLPPVFWHPAASALRCANSYRSRSNSMPHRNWPLWEVPGYVVFSWQKWKVFLNMPWTIDLL